MRDYSRIKDTLPNKLSELMKLGLEDLAICESRPDAYQINMGVFHEFSASNNVCVLCFAGAVMAATFAIPDNTDVRRFYSFNPTINAKLRALDAVRVGDVEEALEWLGRSVYPDLDRSVSNYHRHGPDRWRDDMNKIIADLEAVGL